MPLGLLGGGYLYIWGTQRVSEKEVFDAARAAHENWGHSLVGCLEVWDTSRAAEKEVLRAVRAVCFENWDMS